MGGEGEGAEPPTALRSPLQQPGRLKSGGDANASQGGGLFFGIFSIFFFAFCWVRLAFSFLFLWQTMDKSV